MPDYAKEFSSVMEKEGGDVDRAFNRFKGSFEEYKKGHILQALKDFSVGGGLSVAETIDMIASASVRPRGLAYSTIESLAHSAPSLITGAIGAKGAALAGGTVGTVALPGVGTLSGATIGGVIGFTGGAFLGTVPVEVGAWINQSLEKRGFDMTNPDDVRQAYSDPTLMAQIRSEAERKGLTTAAVDTLFNAFAGRFLK